MSLSSFLRNKRLNAILTQKQVGEKLGFQKPQFVSSMERGTSRPPIIVLRRMCEIYRISEEEMRKAYIEDAMVEARQKAERAWTKREGSCGAEAFSESDQL